MVGGRLASAWGGWERLNGGWGGLGLGGGRPGLVWESWGRFVDVWGQMGVELGGLTEW